MSVYKVEKRGTWYAKFRYTDWMGKRRQLTRRGFTTKRAAKEYENDHKNTLANSTDMTMDALCDLYIEDLRTRRKPTTVYGEECIIRRHIRPYLGKLSINDITVTTIRSWQNAVMQSKSIFSKKPLAPQTLRNISVCLSSILNYAVRFHGLPRNPIDVAKGMGRATRRIDFWEEDEFEKFLSVIDDEDARLYFTVLFQSGMRLGEFLALTPHDIDFRRNQINISKTYNWKLKYVSSPKTETSTRTITMPGETIRSIRKYLEGFYEAPTRIFENVSQKILASMMQRYAGKAGVKPIRIHDLRHSHASLLIHRGIPITAIARRLGHKTPKITLDIYSHVYQDSDEEIAKVLEKDSGTGEKSKTK